MLPTTILIVEDAPATSEFFAELLEWNGYETHLAGTGADALAVVSQHPVDAVLLDNRLPDTTGVTLAPQLRVTLGDNVPIILVTADYGRGLEQAAQAAGVTDFLRKPVGPATLLTCIATHLPREHIPE